MRKDLQARWLSPLRTLFGLLLMALAFKLFFIPSHIAPGGFTGLATICHVLWGWPVGVTAALLNLPLFVFSRRRMGSAFLLRSLAAMLLLSLLLDGLPSFRLSGDLLLSSALGGLLMGLGLSLVLLGNATTGGSDLLAALLSGFFPGISLGWLLLCIEGGIVLLSALALGTEVTLYAAAALLISTRLVDALQAGMQESRLFFVMTRQPESLIRAVSERLHRGATLLEARGAYRGETHPLVLCAVDRRQVLPFKRIVQETDPSAFVVLTRASETMGEGFRRILPPLGDGLQK